MASTAGLTLDDRGPAVFTVTLVMLVLATFFVALRLVSKWGITGRYSSDDFLTVLAWLFTLALSVCILIGTRVGLGAPDSDLHPDWDLPLKRTLYAFTVFYNPSLMATKTAILLLYVRMAAAHRFLRYASYLTLAVVDISGLVLVFLNIFQCRPFHAAYSDTDGRCLDLVSLYLSSAPINIITDLAILLLPLPILTGLRMELRQKIALVATFVVGGFVTVVDIIRIVYLQDALKEELAADPNGSVSASSRPANFTYHVSFSLMWSAVEVSVGIMCACVLVLKPLVMRVVPSLLMETPRPTPVMDSSRFSADVKEQPSPIPVLETIREDGSTQGRQGRVNSGPGGDGEEDEDDGMDFFQMLASDPASPPRPPTEAARSSIDGSVLPPRKTSRRMTILTFRRETISTEPTQAPTQTFLDFVNMGGRKPLTELSASEAWWPILFVSILFFLWGFAYGLLGTLNSEIQRLLKGSPSRAIALHAAYWLAYAVGPLAIGYQILSREGFKATFMTGLAIYACGAMSFWPSSVLKSYAGFFISNFIIALGLSCLEVAANPFIALAGPGELGEARLNFAQGIQGVGSIFSPILAQKALFQNVDGLTLFDVQWCYLAVALFVVFLAVVFFYVPLSEADDDDLEAMTVQRLFNADLDHGAKWYGLSLRQTLLWSGAFVMTMYVGAQESVSYYWGPLMSTITPSTDAFWDQAISHAIFAVGRFLASFFCYIGIPPRLVLLTYISGAFLTSLLTMLLPPGNGARTTLILLTFFESAILPTLFAMILRGQGRHTKFASAVLTSAISGGALWPSVSYGVDRVHRANSRFALRVVVTLFALSTVWPGLLSGWDVWRRWLDPRWSRTRLTTVGTTMGSVEGGSGSASGSGNEGDGAKGLTAHVEMTGVR